MTLRPSITHRFGIASIALFAGLWVVPTNSTESNGLSGTDSVEAVELILAAATNTPLPKPNPRKANYYSKSTELEDSGISGIIYLNAGSKAGAADSIGSKSEAPKLGIAVLDSTGSVDSLVKGLNRLQNGQIKEFLKIRNSLPQSVDRRILDWRFIMSEPEALSSEFVAGFMREAPHWPTQEIMQKRLESALWRENPDSDTIYSIFSRQSPQTATGKLLYAQALFELGFKDEAASKVRQLWRNSRLTAAMEKVIISKFSDYLSNEDHLHRVDMYLFDDRIKAATRTVKFLNAEQKAYFEAFSSVIRKKSNANSLLKKVPKSMRSHPGFVFAQIRHLRRTDNPEDAAKLMMRAPRNPDLLVDRDEWWLERRLIARDILGLGKSKLAYDIVAGHSAESPAKFVEAEFFAGWYALRFNKRLNNAEKHFKNILTAATIPSSISRAYYWLGRTEEARRRTKSANEFYKKAGEYGMAYYGQLARAKLGLNSVGLERPPQPSEGDKFAFNNDDRVKAIKRMNKADYSHRSGALYQQLATELPTTGQIALLTKLAEQNTNYQFVVLIGRTAIKRSSLTASLSFPIPDYLKNAKMKRGVEKSIVFAIARQESSFNPIAKSAAGALGLTQLLPSTAKQTASRNKVSYSKSRLTKDPAYNFFLGSAFLGELVGRFDGSYILTFAGYNAGPSRVRQWIKEFGDPRHPDVDPVDWIERIPFSETRNYVQKVTENLQVYREKFEGRKLDIKNDLHRGS